MAKGDGKTLQLTAQGVVIDCRGAGEPTGSWLSGAAQHVGNWITQNVGLPVWYLVDKSLVDKYPDPKKDPDPATWLSGLPYIVAGDDWNGGQIYVPWAKSWCFWATSNLLTNTWLAHGDRAWRWHLLEK